MYNIPPLRVMTSLHFIEREYYKRISSFIEKRYLLNESHIFYLKMLYTYRSHISRQKRHILKIKCLFIALNSERRGDIVWIRFDQTDL